MDDGDEADVEVLLWTEKNDYAKQLSYYGAKLYASQAIKGAKYKELNKCYQIIISQDCIFPHTSWLLNLDISAQENRMFSCKHAFKNGSVLKIYFTTLASG